MMVLMQQHVGLVVLVLIASTHAQRTCYFKGLNITSDPSYGFGTSRVTPGSKDKGVDFNITILNPISSSEGYISSTVLMKYSSSATYHPLITGTANLCETLKSPNMDPFIRRYIKAFNKYTPLMKNCPLQAGNYTVKNFQMDTSMIPSFIPIGAYALKFVLSRYENQRHTPLLTANFQGEMLPK